MKKILLTCMIGALTQSVIAQCVRPAMLAHWDFNGNTAEQVHGWSSSVVGTLTYTTGQNGMANTAMHFNGSTYIRVPHQNLMNKTSWTITAVVRPTAFNSNDCQGNAILWRGDGGMNEHYSLHMTDNPWDDEQNIINSTTTPVCTTYSPAHTNLVAGASGVPAGMLQSEWLNSGTNPAIVLNNWYCMTASYDGNSETMSLYINAFKVFSRHWPNTYSYVNLNDLFIGASNNVLTSGSPYKYFFEGDIDDIAMYDGAIQCTDAEFPDVARLLCTTCPQASPPLIAHWDFNNANVNEVLNGWTPLPSPHMPPASNAVPGINGIANTAMHFNAGQFLEYAWPQMAGKADVKSWTISAIVRPNPNNYFTGLCQGNFIFTRGPEHYSPHYHLEFFDNYQYTGNDCKIVLPDKLFAGYPAGTGGFTDDKWNSGVDPNWGGLGYPANPFISNVAPGQWYCVNLSYDSKTGELDLFVDGVHVFHQITPNQYWQPAPGVAWQENIFIGSNRDPYSSPFYQYFFDGDIDDIALYGGPTKCPPICLREGHKPSSIDSKPAIEKLGVVPNPATDHINITIPATWGKGIVILSNSMGQTVLRQETSSTQLNMDISHLPVGVYMLKAQFGDNIASEKVIKN